jgi:hypothetical protein
MREQNNSRGRRFTRTGSEEPQSRWRLSGDTITRAGKQDWSQERTEMPTEVKIGQYWSTWVPSRRQWLLARVVRQENGQATLSYDARYGIGDDFREQQADESTMLGVPNLFRFIEAPA